MSKATRLGGLLIYEWKARAEQAEGECARAVDASQGAYALRLDAGERAESAEADAKQLADALEDIDKWSTIGDVTQQARREMGRIARTALDAHRDRVGESGVESKAR